MGGLTTHRFSFANWSLAYCMPLGTGRIDRSNNTCCLTMASESVATAIVPLAHNDGNRDYVCDILDPTYSQDMVPRKGKFQHVRRMAWKPASPAFSAGNDR